MTPKRGEWYIILNFGSMARRGAACVFVGGFWNFQAHVLQIVGRVDSVSSKVYNIKACNFRVICATAIS